MALSQISAPSPVSAAGGRNGRAESDARRALRKNPNDARALHTLGLIARNKGRHGRAVQLLQKAAAAAPEAPDIRCDLGLALKAAGRHDESVAAQRCVTDLLPKSELAWSNLGTSLLAARKFREAIAAFQRAIAFAPENPELHYNLGNALLAAGDPVAAEAAFLRALDLMADHIGALTNLGAALKDQGRLADAETVLRGAITLAPDNMDLRFNLALTLLVAGKFTEGWQTYEARRALPGFAIKPQTLPPWDGSPLSGRQLLVHAEQGIGDTLQFCRYLPRLADDRLPFIFEVSERLHPLLRSLPGNVRLTPRASRNSGCDVEAPLLSLPFLVGPSEPFWPESGPYLSAEPERRARWKKTFDGDDGITIAISWQGNPNYRNDALRSVPLSAFEPLATIPGVRLVSLQQGPGTDQIATLPWRDRLIHLGDEIDRDGAFLDSAAIASAADLVVTSDTALAHLAGAMGLPVWVALAHVPDWRWGTAGEDCPWYPTMRLFRQPAPHDWRGVFVRMAAALAEGQAAGSPLSPSPSTKSSDTEFMQ